MFLLLIALSARVSNADDENAMLQAQVKVTKTEKQVGVITLNQTAGSQEVAPDEDVVAGSFHEWLSNNLHFDNQTAMDAFVKEHETKWQAKASLLQTTSGSTSGSKRGSCPKKYTNQYF